MQRHFKPLACLLPIPTRSNFIERQDAGSPMQTISILIIHSDGSVSERISRSLVRAGYQVHIRPTTEGLHALLDAQAYALLIVDYDGEQCKGSELLRQLRLKGNTKPVILLDRQGSVRRAVEAIQWGASDYLLQDADAHLILLSAAKAIKYCRNPSSRALKACTGLWIWPVVLQTRLPRY